VLRATTAGDRYQIRLCGRGEVLLMGAGNRRPLNVLFLCTANSARSILAEGYLNSIGKERFRAYSAGSHPKGQINPFALELLNRKGIPTGDMRSKAWDEFARPGAPALDIVITVCDQAAGEVCPIWPGHPLMAHWGIADPAAASGSDDDKHEAFSNAFAALKVRIDLLMTLPADQIDKATLKERLDEIGKIASRT
jgi:arsenate reductase (thioredoxin)